MGSCVGGTILSMPRGPRLVLMASATAVEAKYKYQHYAWYDQVKQSNSYTHHS